MTHYKFFKNKGCLGAKRVHALDQAYNVIWNLIKESPNMDSIHVDRSFKSLIRINYERSKISKQARYRRKKEQRQAEVRPAQAVLFG
jgi:hypothetical protein